jgi:hypothetical protein
VVGGGIFYFQSVQPVKEVMLYGEAAETLVSESSEPSESQEKMSTPNETNEKILEPSVGESPDETPNGYERVKGEKNLEE